MGHYGGFGVDTTLTLLRKNLSFLSGLSDDQTVHKCVYRTHVTYYRLTIPTSEVSMSAKNTTAILKKLRDLMKTKKVVGEPLQAYIIPSGDSHQVCISYNSFDGHSFMFNSTAIVEPVY